MATNSNCLIFYGMQSKRLPNKDTSSTSLRLSGFSHSSWISEMQQASDKSIIISEILDSRTRNLVSVSRISDYVLSNELVSMALAMVAEDKQINRVLEELFAEEVRVLSPSGNFSVIVLTEIFNLFFILTASSKCCLILVESK